METYFNAYCENITGNHTMVDNMNITTLNFSSECFNQSRFVGVEWTPLKFDASLKNIILAIVLTIIDVVTIFGNLLVIVAFFVERKLFHPFNMFIFNLAVTDFLVAITAMTFYTIDTLLGYWPFGYVMCGLWIYFDFAMTFASVFTLVAISIDRFWCVTWAVHYRVHNDNTKTAIILATIWICVLVIWTPPFIGDRLKHNEVYFCIWEPSDNTEFVIFVAVIGHYIPCAIMVFCYIKVFMVMRRQAAVVGNMGMLNAGTSSRPDASHSRQCSSAFSHEKNSSGRKPVSESQIQYVSGNVQSNNGAANSPNVTGARVAKQRRVERGNQGNANRERRIFITLTYVIVSYLICWFPFYIAFDTYAWKPNVVPADLYTFFFWMTYVNSTLNPFIYAYTSREFRSAFIKVLTNMCSCIK